MLEQMHDALKARAVSGSYSDYTQLYNGEMLYAEQF